MNEQPDVSLSAPIKERNHSTHIDSESLTLANVAPIEQLSDAAEVKEAAVKAAMLNRPSHLTEFSHLPISNHDLLPPILPNPNNTVILPSSFIEPNSFASGQTDSAESEHVSRPKIGFVWNTAMVSRRFVFHVHKSRGTIVLVGSC